MAHEIKIAGLGCFAILAGIALNFAFWAGLIYAALWSFKHFFGS